MTTSNFTTTILVDNSAKEAFDAINNVRGWWHGKVEGNTANFNDEFEYRWEDIHYSKQKVVEIIPNARVVWLVTDSNLSFTEDKNEWKGTRIIFEIFEKGNKTEIRFTHFGLTPEFECFDACSNGWTQLIQKSLFGLITAGQGAQVF